MRWYWTSLVNGPMLLRFLADGDVSSSQGQPAASSPFHAPLQTRHTTAGFGADSSTPSRTAATPPRPSTGKSTVFYILSWRALARRLRSV